MKVKEVVEVLSKSHIFIQEYSQNRNCFITTIWNNQKDIAERDIDRVEISTTHIKNGTPCFVITIRNV